jgi:hypothetical protein
VLASATPRRPATLADLLPADLSARLDGLDLLSRKILAGKLQGERRSKRRGRSVEFDDYREYVPGDDLRHIDWNVFARLDRFFLKIFQEEEDLALHILLDRSASMSAGAPNKLLFAARLAVALGYVGLVNNNRVLMTVFGGPSSVSRLEPLRGRRNVQRLGQFVLDAAFAAGSTGTRAPQATAARAPADDFTATLRAVASGQGDLRGKGVVVLLSDLLIPPLGGYEEGLRLLAAAAHRGGGGGGGGMDAYVLQVLAPGELDPAREYRGGEEHPEDRTPALSGDLRLTDAETGRAAEVTVTPELLRQYKAAAERYVKTVATFCAARGLHHALVRSDESVPNLVLQTLRRQGMLK